MSDNPDIRRTCRVLSVRPGAEAEYDRRHRELWPDLAAQIEQVYSSFTIFRRDRTVVVYGEHREGEHSETDVGERWTKYMSEVLEDSEIELAEVMHLPHRPSADSEVQTISDQA